MEWGPSVPCGKNGEIAMGENRTSQTQEYINKNTTGLNETLTGTLMTPPDKDCSTVCRICLSGETSLPSTGTSAGEPLISPCRCKGTMGLYHRSCLETWLSHSRTLTCEICKYEYRVKRPGFYAYLKSRKPFEQPERGVIALEVDLIIATVGFVISGILIYTCIQMGKNSIFNHRDLEQDYAYEMDNHLVKWIVLVLTTLAFLWCFGRRFVSSIIIQKKYFLRWQLRQRNNDFSEYCSNQSGAPLLRSSMSSVFLSFFQRSRTQSVLRETAIDINPELVESSRQASPNNPSLRSFSSFSSVSLEPVGYREPLVLSTFRRDNSFRMLPLHHSTPSAIIAESPIYDDPGVFYSIAISPIHADGAETPILRSPMVEHSFRGVQLETMI